MKPTNDLFDLIHALTKSEKRFFKLQSSLPNGEKNYVRLFDAIEKTSSNHRLLDVLPAPTNLEDHYLPSSLVKGVC